MTNPGLYHSIFKNEEYSDVTIAFSDRQVPCHKVVICTQSEYFKMLCGKGASFAESTQKVIELKDDDPDAVEAILRQLYCGDYRNDLKHRATDWKFHAEVAKAAKKYLIPKAADWAEERCAQLLDELTAARDVCDAILYIRSKYAYDDAMTQRAAALQDKHINNLLIDSRFVDSLTVEEVREHFDRLRKMVGGSFEQTITVCQHCGKVRPLQRSFKRCYCIGIDGEPFLPKKCFIIFAREQ